MHRLSICIPEYPLAWSTRGFSQLELPAHQARGSVVPPPLPLPPPLPCPLSLVLPVVYLLRSCCECQRSVLRMSPRSVLYSSPIFVLGPPPPAFSSLGCDSIEKSFPPPDSHQTAIFFYPHLINFPSPSTQACKNTVFASILPPHTLLSHIRE